MQHSYIQKSTNMMLQQLSHNVQVILGIICEPTHQFPPLNLVTSFGGNMKRFQDLNNTT